MILRDILNEAQRHLKEAAQNDAALEARVLFRAASGWRAEQMIASDRETVSPEIQERFSQLIARRKQGEPVSQITGEKEFWSLTFRVTRDVLTPRPDSETLIELALELSADIPPRTIIDLGTGTGCLLAALLTEFPNSQGVAIDKSVAALAIARENFQRLGLHDRVTAVLQDFATPPEPSFDLVISNPPYIPATDRAELMRDVRDYEPAEALFAGEDGLAAYRVICANLPGLLAPEQGVAILEIGQGQEQAVCALLEAAFKAERQFVTFHTKKDLAGITRAIGVKRC